MTTPAPSKVPDLIRKNLDEWRRLERFWYFVHYSCGLAGVVAGVFAAAPPEVLVQLLGGRLWGVLAAVATGLVTFLGPLQKGEGYKNAYYRLANAVARFESVSDTPVNWLLEEHKNAQKIILNRDPQPDQQAPALGGEL
jgi:hypothetical protein